MCGICGFVSINENYKDIKGLINRMNKLLIHRGPDEDGYHIENNLALGMRRLKIIDLSTGKQPIFNEKGDIIVIYNGEIYNFRELRDELIQKGHTFKTASDTEVIVHAYEEYNETFLNKLNGMFAFCIFDKRNNKILIARDRVGIKPLYYVNNRKFFAFSSEMKSLFEIEELSKELDVNAIDEYLTYEYSLAPKTVVKAIKKLQPGHYMIFQNGNIEIKNYWKIEYSVTNLSYYDCKDKLYETLSHAVKRRLISDVPLGAFLSGGIDSSIMVGLMARHSSHPVKTFSIGFKNQSYNELNYARLIARRFNTEHHESILEKDLLESMDTFIDYLDEPMADVSIFPTHLVSQEARKNVTVILSGDGGDELFGGYETYLAQNIAKKIYDWLPRIFTSRLFPGICSRIAPTSKKKGIINRIKRFVEGGTLPKKLLHYRWMTYCRENEKKCLFSEKFTDLISAQTAVERVVNLYKRFQEWDELNQMMLSDFYIYLVEDILTKVDRMSMAVSLEARVPYLDHTVVELAYQIPGRFKINGLKTKTVLKDTFSDLLPKEILNRSKEGFSIPMKNWLSNELKDTMREVLNKSDIKKIGLFNYNFLNKLIDQHISGSHNHAHKLWSLMVLMIWWKKYIE